MNSGIWQWGGLDAATAECYNVATILPPVKGTERRRIAQIEFQQDFRSHSRSHSGPKASWEERLHCSSCGCWRCTSRCQIRTPLRQSIRRSASCAHAPSEAATPRQPMSQVLADGATCQLIVWRNHRSGPAQHSPDRTRSSCRIRCICCAAVAYSAASSTLRMLLNRQDAPLGPWVAGRGPLEDALQAFAGTPGGPSQPPWEAGLPSSAGYAGVLQSDPQNCQSAVEECTTPRLEASELPCSASLETLMCAFMFSSSSGSSGRPCSILCCAQTPEPWPSSRC